MTSPDATGAAAPGRRGWARLCAVQALYQIEISGAASRRVIEEFIDYRLDREDEDGASCEADPDFFSDLVSGTEARDEEISDAVGTALSEDWTYDRLDTILRQVLRAGTYELMARIDVPARVVINEYVELTGAFFEGSETGFVNAVLDRLGRHYRSGEMVPAGESPTESG